MNIEREILSHPRLCLAEDDALMGESLVERLELEGYAVTWARTAQAAISTLRAQRFDGLVCDVRLPDMNGDAMYRSLVEDASFPLPPTIFITGYGTIEAAVELLKLGAVDYITKPIDLRTFMGKLRSLCEYRQPSGELGRLGSSPAMQQLATRLPAVARHRNSPVLLRGESGVGKEVVARAIHTVDPGGGEFVAVNCAAIPPNLVESELFGHAKGAFTGAGRARRGVFEQAQGGTLFLDEIGDLPLDTQAKFLRVIQEREITPIGSEQRVSVDVRLICATHRDIKQLVADGAFREDLFYRINVLPLFVPPLRERCEDVLPLAQHFLSEHARRFPDEAKTFTARAREKLLSYHWPGNVRELKHVIERACILVPGRFIDEGELELETEPSDSAAGTLREHLEQNERTRLVQALVAHDWGIQKTAAALGITRKTLWQKMKHHMITRPK